MRVDCDSEPTGHRSMGCCESLCFAGSERAPKLNHAAPVQGVPQRGSRRLDFVDNEDGGGAVEDSPLLEQAPSTEGIPAVEGPLDEAILERMLAEADDLTD